MNIETPPSPEIAANVLLPRHETLRTDAQPMVPRGPFSVSGRRQAGRTVPIV